LLILCWIYRPLFN